MGFIGFSKSTGDMQDIACISWIFTMLLLGIEMDALMLVLLNSFRHLLCQCDTDSVAYNLQTLPLMQNYLDIVNEELRTLFL
jgi:hypothetical protein